jgi:hypothetical protein
VTEGAGQMSITKQELVDGIKQIIYKTYDEPNIKTDVEYADIDEQGGNVTISISWYEK